MAHFPNVQFHRCEARRLALILFPLHSSKISEPEAKLVINRLHHLVRRLHHLFRHLVCRQSGVGEQLGCSRRRGVIGIGAFRLVTATGVKVGLWIFGSVLNVDVVTAAILGLSVLLITGVVTWKECLAESVAWDTLTWFAALIVMARYLNK
ncbi:dicarboxylate transporter 1 [Perilla frutescens var. hirtella]|nr:dicarboxylate transporter 1 [Perilla frutescens var. frutescens]KAH6776506.1 dicarboxylate transporter 1 [Perilla frutescens var. hirtella]